MAGPSFIRSRELAGYLPSTAGISPGARTHNGALATDGPEIPLGIRSPVTLTVYIPGSISAGTPGRSTDPTDKASAPEGLTDPEPMM